MEPRADTSPPEAFRAAVELMRAVPVRSELLIEEMPAPQRIAPFSFALSADVTVDGEDVGGGRLVLLHDPHGNEAWEGDFRCVAYVRADIEPETAADQMLAGVGWSWLTEALDAEEASYRAVSGTVTVVSSESFGGLESEGAGAQIEVRASWTPTGDPSADLGAHTRAWTQLLCTAAGLPPVPEGVALLPGRRGQRGGH